MFTKRTRKSSHISPIPYRDNKFVDSFSNEDDSSNSLCVCSTVKYSLTMALDKIQSILTHVAEVAKIANFEVIPHEDVLKGDGLLSEFYTGDVKNKDTGELIKAYIKVPPKYDVNFKSDVYVNENQFYEKIFPEFDRFQREKGVKEPFDNIPKFYCGESLPGKEYVVLENLKDQDYVLHDKTKFIGEDLLNEVFRLYGKFHALAFAFKKQNPESYERLGEPLSNVVCQLANISSIQAGVKHVMAQAYDSVKKTNEEYAERIRPYAENVVEIFVKSSTYEGEYSTLTHGDCWSNNLLLKYRDGTLENTKLIDFQMIRDSSPIHDLSHFFYCGASKKEFDRLDDYLDIYYKSFSDFCKELGSDAEALFPKEVLKSEWRRNSLWGIFMSFTAWQFKLLEKEKLEGMGVSSKQKFQEMIQKVLRSDRFRGIIDDIVLHALEYNIF